MHTTEEAKGLWCPMVRLVVQSSIMAPITGFNSANDARTPKTSTCVSERCAMWRWDGAVKMPEKREADTIWPDEDDPQTEPQRQVTLKGKLVPVPDWAVWVPISGEGNNLSGGCWVEPQERVDAQYAEQHANRMAMMRGYCGLAGSPVR